MVITDQKVDVLPDGWKWVQLGSVCAQDKNIIDPKDADTCCPYLGLEHIESNTGNILRDPQKVIKGEGKSTTFLFDDRHILYGKLRPYLNKVALPEFRGRCTTELIPLLPREIDREYLAWLLRRPSTIQAAMREKTGSRMPRANMDSLLKLQVPLPPLPEQKRITAIINEQMAAVAKAMAACEVQLAAAKTLSASYLRFVFESEEVRNWERYILGDCVSKIGSGVTPSGGQKAYVPKGISLIRSQNVLMNNFSLDGLAFITQLQDESMANTRISSSDVLLNITGASIGRVCVVPDQVLPANVNQHVSIIRLTRRLLPNFLCLYLSSPQFQQFIWAEQSGATRQALTKSDIEKFVIPRPSIAKQKEISDNYEAQASIIDRLIQSIESQLLSLVALPKSVIRKAFRGEL